MFFYNSIIVKFSIPFAIIAIKAACNEIYNIVITSAYNWVNVVAMQYNIGSFSSAILTSEFVTLENLKSYFLT